MSVVDPKSGALIDPETGEVLEESLPDPEWHGERSRAGAPTTRRVHDYGVLSFVRVEKWDARGGKLDALKAERLAKLHAKLRQSNRKLVMLLSMVNRLCRVHNLPDRVCEEACFYARKLFAVYRGYRPSERLLERIAAAAVYVAAHVHGYPVTVEVDVKFVWRLHQLLNVKTATTIRKRIYYYMNRIAAELKLEHGVVDLAWRLYVKYGRAGPSPQAIAAALTYVAAKLLAIFF